MFQVGSSLEGKSLLVETASVSETKKGSKYLKLTLRDKSGSISGNLWDYSEPLHAFVKPGVVVRVSGSIESYMDKPQLNVKSLFPSDEPVMKFARTTALDIEEMWAHLVHIISEMKDPLAKFILEELVLKAMAESVKQAPAARGVHSAYYGGLLEHVWGMVRMVKPIVAHYQAAFSAPISEDKVLFGLIAHDLGKAVEYDFATPAFASTPIGILTNHIVLGPAWVYEYANKWWAKEQKDPMAKPLGHGMDPGEFKMARAELMHIVASHHGCLEYGSPIVPATLEAILVHQMDMIDSKVMHALDLIQNKPGAIQGFTEKSYIANTMFKR